MSVADNLGKFIEDLNNTYLQNAMEEACRLIQTTAQQKCPRDTGNLSRSIDFEVADSAGGGKEGCVYTNVEYAPYVEFGTGIYATKGGGRSTPWVYKGSHGWVTTKGSKAQPFLEPALQTNTSAIRDLFTNLF